VGPRRSNSSPGRRPQQHQHCQQQPAAAADEAVNVARVRRHGHCTLPQVLGPEQLRLAQAAFERVRPTIVEQGYAIAVEGRSPALKISQQQVLRCGEPALLELLALPQITSLIDAVSGGGATLRAVGMMCTEPHKPGDAAGGYIDWHTDNSGDRVRPIHPTRSLWTKVFIHLSDSTADGGCTAVVDGSHRWSEERQPSLDPERWQYTGERQTEMPGMVRAVVPAGGAFIFDTNCWHCALPNLSNRERKAVQLVFSVPNELYPGPDPDLHAAALEEGLSPAVLRLLETPPVYVDPFAGGVAATVDSDTEAGGMRRAILTLDDITAIRPGGIHGMRAGV
jgi:hypothetical protein